MISSEHRRLRALFLIVTCTWFDLDILVVSLDHGYTGLEKTCGLVLPCLSWIVCCGLLSSMWLEGLDVAFGLTLLLKVMGQRPPQQLYLRLDVIRTYASVVIGLGLMMHCDLTYAGSLV